MNKIVSSVFLVLVAAFAGGAFAAQPVARRMRPAGASKPSGGLVFSQATGKHICILNDQSIVSAECLEKAARDVTARIHSPIVVTPASAATSPAAKVEAALKNPKVGAIVIFTEDDALDSITYFPDRGYCIVNVRALAKDGASADRIASRAAKMVWRSLGMVLGAGEAVGGYTILQRVSSLKDLDAVSATAPTPEQHNRMVDSSSRLGIKMVKVASYRDACRQGWAPAPQNDEQKKIWEEFNGTPTNPLKIQFDPKTGKGQVK